MTTTDLRSSYHAIFEAISDGDVDRLGQYVAHDVVDHQLVLAQGDGLPGLTYWVETTRRVLPDLAATVQDTVVEGDTVAGRVLFTGTLDSTYLTAAPTEQWVELDYFVFMRFDDGKVVEWWDASNTTQMLHDIGVEFVAPTVDPAFSGRG